MVAKLSLIDIMHGQSSRTDLHDDFVDVVVVVVGAISSRILMFGLKLSEPKKVVVVGAGRS